MKREPFAISRHIGTTPAGPRHRRDSGRNHALRWRVSTDAQNTDSQREELEAWAERAGHTAFRVYEDGRRPDRPARRFWDGYKEMGYDIGVGRGWI